MRRRSFWTFLLFLAAGMIFGNIVGQLLAGYGVRIFAVSDPVAELGPLMLNLGLVSFRFGLSIQANLGGALGLIVGFLLYRQA